MCGSWTYLDSRDIKKVRKARACIWCGETIEIGQPAHNVAGIFEGEFDSQYYHPECNAACKQWFASEGRGDDCFEPYEFMRGLPMDKYDYRAMQAKNNSTKETVGSNG